MPQFCQINDNPDFPASSRTSKCRNFLSLAYPLCSIPGIYSRPECFPLFPLPCLSMFRPLVPMHKSALSATQPAAPPSHAPATPHHHTCRFTAQSPARQHQGQHATPPPCSMPLFTAAHSCQKATPAPYTGMKKGLPRTGAVLFVVFCQIIAECYSSTGVSVLSAVSSAGVSASAGASLSAAASSSSSWGARQRDTRRLPSPIRMTRTPPA